MKLLPEYIKVDTLKAKVLHSLQDPRKMRMAVVLGIGFVGLVLIGLPMRAKMRSLEKQLLEESQRQEIITAIQQLKSRDKAYQMRLNKDGSLNWWVEYILNGSREYNLKVLKFKPYVPRERSARMWTYQGTFLQFRFSGNYHDLTKFIRWVEDNKWSMRITRLIMRREKKDVFIKADMSIAVLVNRLAKETPSKAGKEAEKGHPGEKKGERNVS